MVFAVLTACGRLLRLPLSVGGAFPAFIPFVGRVGRWRSSGCALRAHKQIICVIRRKYRRFIVRVV